MNKQINITRNNLPELLNNTRPMLVCGHSFEKFDIYNTIKRLSPELIQFSDFTPNPSYDSVAGAVKCFKENKCDFMIVAGGGSAMDTGKCAKLFMNMDDTVCYLEQDIVANDIPILAIPTTAGTGSEATKYSIIYYKGEKKTVTHDSSIPGYILFDGMLLNTLPDYQRKATMLDALCHAIESFWSVKSNETSMAYADEAIRLIYSNMKSYLDNTSEGNEAMLMAANIAGKAINITGTTAGHAMCYKPTKKFNIAHGHAVALSMPYLWHIMLENINKYNDVRGSGFVMASFEKIASAMGCSSPEQAADSLAKLLDEFGLLHPVQCDKDTIEQLASTVDASRLSTTPVQLTKENIICIYGKTYL